MRMEKINDHQVRFMISGQDLKEHNLTLVDLKYGEQKTVELFKEMLNEASEKYEFNKEELPIMVEAIPLNQDELLVIVSVVENSDELDPHFSRFAKSDVEESVQEKAAPQFFEEADASTMPKRCLLQFSTIDEVISFCKKASWYPGKSTLYKNHFGEFFMVLHRPSEASPMEFLQLLNNLSEYGEIMEGGSEIYAYYKEHETPVMEDVISKLKNM